MIKKVYKYTAAFLISTFFLVGCSKFSTPEQLIHKPKNDINKEEIRKSIEEFIPPRAKLTIPLNSKEAGAINEVDLDGDNKNEVVAFYEEQERNFEIGFIILKENNGKWEMLDLIKGEGYDIEYASFYDLNKDGKSEIIISWDYGQSNKTNCIYSLENKKIKEIFYDKSEGIKIDDLNKDNNLDIIIFKYDDKNSNIMVSLYNYKKIKLDLADKIDMKAYDMTYLDVKIDKAFKDKKGIFINIPLETHSSYTELIVIENNKLKKIFNDSSKTYQIYPVGNEDIDNDGITEIGLLTKPIGYENEALANIPWISTWYKWNGNDGLNFVLENYYDYNEGYKFDIPKKWKDKFTLKQYENDESKDIIFYYSKNYPNEKIDILKISSFNKNVWEKTKTKLKLKNEDFILLDKNENRVFIGFLNNKNLSKNKSMIIKKEDIIKNFKLIY